MSQREGLLVERVSAWTRSAEKVCKSLPRVAVRLGSPRVRLLMPDPRAASSSCLGQDWAAGHRQSLAAPWGQDVAPTSLPLARCASKDSRRGCSSLCLLKSFYMSANPVAVAGRLLGSGRRSCRWAEGEWAGAALGPSRGQGTFTEAVVWVVSHRRLRVVHGLERERLEAGVTIWAPVVPPASLTVA